METQKDFEFWLDSLKGDESDNMHELYKCINDETSYSGFSCTRDNDILLITSDFSDKTLKLSSEQAKNEFLNLLVDRDADPVFNKEDQEYFDECNEKD